MTAKLRFAAENERENDSPKGFVISDSLLWEFILFTPSVLHRPLAFYNSSGGSIFSVTLEAIGRTMAGFDFTVELQMG